MSREIPAIDLSSVHEHVQLDNGFAVEEVGSLENIRALRDTVLEIYGDRYDTVISAVPQKGMFKLCITHKEPTIE